MMSAAHWWLRSANNNNNAGNVNSSGSLNNNNATNNNIGVRPASLRRCKSSVNGQKAAEKLPHSVGRQRRLPYHGAKGPDSLPRQEKQCAAEEHLLRALRTYSSVSANVICIFGAMRLLSQAPGQRGSLPAAAFAKKEGDFLLG